MSVIRSVFFQLLLLENDRFARNQRESPPTDHSPSTKRSKDSSGSSSLLPLLVACYEGNIDYLYALLEEGTNANEFSVQFDVTPLILASTLRDPQAVLALVSHGVDVNIQNLVGRSALSVSTGLNNASVARVLLEHGANIHVRDWRGDTPLHSAARYESAEAASLLLKHGANVNAQNNDGSTPLHLATEGSSSGTSDELASDRVLEILLANGASTGVLNAAGHTPLTVAIRQKKHEGLRLLLQHGADPNKPMNLPLRLAVEMNQPQVVRLLLDHGADANGRRPYVCKDGRESNASHLFVACDKDEKFIEVVTLLIEHRGDVHFREASSGDTLLMRAVKNCNFQMISALLKRGVDMNVANRNRHTALYVACDHCTLDCLYALLRYSSHDKRPALK